MNMSNEFVEVDIKKPLYGTYVQIRSKYIKEAILSGKLLKITIPQGVGIHDPKEWAKTGKKYEQIFLIPDCPMVLYGNYVKIGQTKEQVEEEKIVENHEYTEKGQMSLVQAWKDTLKKKGLDK